MRAQSLYYEVSFLILTHSEHSKLTIYVNMLYWIVTRADHFNTHAGRGKRGNLY